MNPSHTSSHLGSSADDPKPRRIGWRAAGAVFVPLLLFAVLSLTAALQKTPTFDEPLHLYAGYSYLMWGDFRVNSEHPPLAKLLAALPLTGIDSRKVGITADDRDLAQRDKYYEWLLADRFLRSSSSMDAVWFYPKLVMIALGLLLGLLVFLWAREIYGFTAAVIALAFYCFDPNFLAHSSIVHTDVPFALTFFAGTYFFWRTLRRADWPNLLATSLCFALSAITKFSFLSVIPVWLALGTLRIYSSRPVISVIAQPHVMARAVEKAILVMIVLASASIAAYGVVWAAYGFRFDAVSLEHGQMAVGRLLSEENWLTPLVLFNSKYFSLPEAWVYGIAYVFRSFQRPSYIFGQISDAGSWLYFPVAFLFKTPLPTLLTMVVAAVMSFRRGRMTLNELFLLVPALGFFLIAVASPLNIGLRHILPMYPFIFVWLGGTAAAVWTTKHRMARWGVSLLVIWLVGASVKTYPHFLAFFNELAGGPAGGHKILVDSNLDWGQDLRALKAWMDDQRVAKITLAYFGTAKPSDYGIEAAPAPGSLVSSDWSRISNTPVSSYIAISATYLAGLYLPHADAYAKFRDRTPVASIGHSILVFRNEP